MFHALVTQSPAVRLLPRWLLLTLANAFVLEGVRLAAQARLDDAGSAAPAFGAHLMASLVLWLPLAAYLLVLSFRPRCGEWVLALPVRGREIWRAHLVSLAAAAVALLASAALCVAFYDELMVGGAARGRLPRPGILGVLPAALACALPLAALLATRRAGSSRLPARARELVLMAAILVAALPATAALSLAPDAALAAPVALAALMAWLAGRRMPEALELGVGGRAHAGRARAGGGAAPARVEGASRPVRRPRVLVAGTVLRLLLRQGNTWVTLPVLLAYGALISGSFFALFGDARERNGFFSMFALLTVYLLLTPLLKQMRVLHLLDPLPVPRRALFAAAVVPGLGATALGYALAELAGHFTGRAAGVGAPAAWHPFVALVIVLPYLLLAAALLRQYAPGAGERSRAVGTVAVQAVAIGSAILVLGLAIRRKLDPEALTLGLRGAAGAVAAAAPGGVATVWLLTLALLALAWRLAEARFERAEAPLGRPGPCLTGGE